MKWLRLYHETLHDPKVQTLPAELFRSWINVLIIASEATDRGTLPDARQVAFLLRVREAKAREMLSRLTALGLLDEQEDGSLKPHNWDVRQPDSDTTNDRVRKYRERIRANGESPTAHYRHKAKVFARDNHACVYCLSTKKLVLDHLIPITMGGLGDPDNLATACRSCNAGKRGSLVEEVGYVFQNPAAEVLYEAAKSRFGVTVRRGAVTPSVTVTAPGINGDSHGHTRARSEEIRGEEIRGEQPPLPPGTGGAVAAAGFAPLPPEVEAAIGDARARVNDDAGEIVRREWQTIDRQLGGRWDLFLEALEAAHNRRPKLEVGRVFSWCMSRAKGKLVEPPRPPGSAPNGLRVPPSERATPPPPPEKAASAGCPHCAGQGLAYVYRRPDASPRLPSGATADCVCPLGRRNRGGRDEAGRRAFVDLEAVLAGRSSWQLEQPEAGS